MLCKIGKSLSILSIILLSCIYVNGQCDNLYSNILNDRLSRHLLTSYQVNDTVQIENKKCSFFTKQEAGILFSDHTHNDDWYYIKIDNNSSTKETVLELDNSQTDQVDIFTLNEGILSPLLNAGDRIPFYERNLEHRNILIPLSLKIGNNQFIIHVVNRGSYSIPIEIFEKESFTVFDNNRNILIGVYIGFLLIFVLFVIGSTIISSYDPTTLFYLIYLIFTGTYFLVELGFGDKYLWPNHPHLEEPIIFILILGATGSFLLLVHDIFNINKSTALLEIIFRSILGGIGLGIVSVVFNFIKNDVFFTFFFYSVLIMVVCAFLYSMLAGVSAIRREIPYAKSFLWAFAAIVVAIIIKPAGLAGLLPNSGFVRYGGMIGHSIEIIALSIILLLEFFSKIKYSASLESKVVHLEKAALQAQMNPHFIFNCLNSIQKFIATNDKEQAMDYLSKFASLIRKTLNASASKKITLEEEVRLMELYLEMEQLRFKSKFDYKISLAPKIDIEDTLIPPLMIQPFVENAIIHGLSGKKENGLIEVIFQPAGDYIKVMVRDNGQGLKDNQESTHKSMAMNITRQRLSHLNQNHDEMNLIAQNLIDDDGHISGAEITLMIRIF